jgi:ABC-type enterochelin transport system ATPase subunit
MYVAGLEMGTNANISLEEFPSLITSLKMFHLLVTQFTHQAKFYVSLQVEVHALVANGQFYYPKGLATKKIAHNLAKAKDQMDVASLIQAMVEMLSANS